MYTLTLPYPKFSFPHLKPFEIWKRERVRNYINLGACEPRQAPTTASTHHINAETRRKEKARQKSRLGFFRRKNCGVPSSRPPPFFLLSIPSTKLGWWGGWGVEEGSNRKACQPNPPPLGFLVSPAFASPPPALHKT